MTTKTKSSKTTASSNGNLAERAMIVRRTVHRWRGQKTDRLGAGEHAKSKKADARMFHLRKWIVPRSAIRPIAEIDREGKRLHKFRTLPWSDGGYRILSADAYFDYMAEQREIREKFDTAVNVFCDAMEEHFKKGKELLGDAAEDLEVIRDTEQLRRKFAYEITVTPLPTANDFRVGLAQPEVKSIRAQIETETRAAVAEAMQEPYERIHTHVRRMVERLNKFAVGKDGKTQHTFRNSLVDNLKELVAVLPTLNVVNDPKLNGFTKEIEDKLLVDPETLRDDEKIRKTTAAQAEKILKKLEAFV